MSTVHVNKNGKVYQYVINFAVFGLIKQNTTKNLFYCGPSTIKIEIVMDNEYCMKELYLL